jgi:hypothetical protein
MSSTADSKFLHRPQQVHHQELQIESGAGVISFPVPFGFRRSLEKVLR